MPDQVRIDKWLWAARFFKTRSLAADAVDSGKVRCNDERVKPARKLRPGDLLAINNGATEWKSRLSPCRSCALAPRRRNCCMQKPRKASRNASTRPNSGACSMSPPARSRAGRPSATAGCWINPIHKSRVLSRKHTKSTKRIHDTLSVHMETGSIAVFMAFPA